MSERTCETCRDADGGIICSILLSEDAPGEGESCQYWSASWEESAKRLAADNERLKAELAKLESDYLAAQVSHNNNVIFREKRITKLLDCIYRHVQRNRRLQAELSSLKKQLSDAPTITMHVIDGHTVSHFCPDNLLDLEEGGECVVKLVKIMPT